jgi:hypothetical protein
MVRGIDPAREVQVTADWRAHMRGGALATLVPGSWHVVLGANWRGSWACRSATR